MKLLPSVFSSLYSRIKIFVFAVNSKRHFSIFVRFISGLQEKTRKSKVIFAVCRLPQTSCLTSPISIFDANVEKHFRNRSIKSHFLIHEGCIRATQSWQPKKRTAALTLYISLSLRRCSPLKIIQPYWEFYRCANNPWERKCDSDLIGYFFTKRPKLRSH